MSNFQLPPGFRPSAPSSSASSSSPYPQSQSQSQSQPQQDDPAARERAAAQDEMKRSMIAAMLESSARERLSRISLTRPQLAAQVEDLLVRMGQQGQVRGKVTDEALKGLLEQVSNPPPMKSTAPVPVAGGRTKSLGGGITIHRKGADSDSDEYDL